jgi:hypothetical protein
MGIGQNKIVLQGHDAKTLLKLQKYAQKKDNKRFFQLAPIGGFWFVQYLEWQTHKHLTPSLSFSAVLIEVIKPRKSR